MKLLFYSFIYLVLIAILIFNTSFDLNEVYILSLIIVISIFALIQFFNNIKTNKMKENEFKQLKERVNEIDNVLAERIRKEHIKEAEERNKTTEEKQQKEV